MQFKVKFNKQICADYIHEAIQKRQAVGFRDRLASIVLKDKDYQRYIEPNSVDSGYTQRDEKEYLDCKFMGIFTEAILLFADQQVKRLGRDAVGKLYGWEPVLYEDEVFLAESVFEYWEFILEAPTIKKLVVYAAELNERKEKFAEWVGISPKMFKALVALSKLEEKELDLIVQHGYLMSDQEYPIE